MNIDQATNIIMEVIKGLKEECNKHIKCDERCKLYDTSESCCLLKHIPCVYDIPRIEEAIYNIVKEEIENE